MSVPRVVIDEIDRTIGALDQKKFDPDPIAGARFSKIASVVSSSYKRHGFILETALFESLKRRRRFDVWQDSEFQVSRTADAAASNFKDEPQTALNSQLAYETDGVRRLQVDLVAYEKKTKTLGIYEIKRGSGLHDAGKKRQILRDLICMQLLAKSYGQHLGYDVADARAYIIFYYGKCSIGEPFALTSGDLDEHFGYAVKTEVEAANDLFQKKLHTLLVKQNELPSPRDVIKPMARPKVGWFKSLFRT